MGKKYEALLIDLDGTLADTEGGLYQVYQKYLESYGVKGSLEEFQSLVGPTLPEIVERLDKIHGIQGSESKYQEFILEYYQGAAKPYFFAKRFLEEMQSCGYRLALVTSAHKDLADAFLKRHGVDGFFEAVIGGGEGPGKPDSFIYFKALEVLSLSANEALALEDSPAGIEAALGAGIDTMAVHHPKLKESPKLDFAKDLCHAAVLLSGKAFVNPVSKDFSLELIEGGELTLSPEQKSAVDAIWEKKPSQVFDGKIFTVAQNQSKRCLGHFVSYSYLYAATKDRRLVPMLRPMGVSGVCVCQGAYLLARRQEVVLYDGYWELVPSGGVDDSTLKGSYIDYRELLKQEFEEEVGVDRHLIESVEPFALAHEMEGLDLCLRVQLSADARKLAFKPTSEYAEFRWVDQVEVGAFLESFKDKLVPLTYLLLSSMEL